MARRQCTLHAALPGDRRKQNAQSVDCGGRASHRRPGGAQSLGQRLCLHLLLRRPCTAADLLEQESLRPGAAGCDAPGAYPATTCSSRSVPLRIPVIFLTALGTTADRVRGLRAGADDYLVKPFEVVELIARVETVLRRAGKTEEHYAVGDVERRRQVHAGHQGRSSPCPSPGRNMSSCCSLSATPTSPSSATPSTSASGRSDFLGDSRTVDLHVQRHPQKAGLAGSAQLPSTRSAIDWRSTRK